MLKKPKMKEAMEVLEMEMRPMLHLDSKTLPEIKSWTVGKKYNIILSVVQKSMRESHDGRMEAGFEVTKAESADKEG